MKRKTATLKAPVYIRSMQLKDGRSSLYLDIRSNGVRSYKYLKMYLEPSTTAEAKRRNAEVMKKVEKMKEELVLDITYARAGLDDHSFRARMTLVEWMAQYERHLAKNGCSKSFRYNIMATAKYLKAFRPETQLKEVDARFIDDFHEFLKRQKVKKENAMRNLAPNTVCCRLRNLRSALNFAVREKLLSHNPCLDAETPFEEEEKRRTYLTVEEVKRLIDTPCPSQVLKHAFLFSVFSALRISDVRALTWRNIVKDNDNWRVEICQKKTQAMLCLPLNRMARMWLQESSCHAPDDKVFGGLRTFNKVQLAKWMRDAGIEKTVTYHASRHTFAVLALHAGVDIYTVSKLMGHASLKNTQIYANILDRRKKSTVSLLDTVL